MILPTKKDRRLSTQAVSQVSILHISPVIHHGTLQFPAYHPGYICHNICEIRFQISNIQMHFLNAPLGPKDELHGVYMRGIGKTADSFPPFATEIIPGPHRLEPGQDAQLLYDIIGPINEK